MSHLLIDLLSYKTTTIIMDNRVISRAAVLKQISEPDWIKTPGEPISHQHIAELP